MSGKTPWRAVVEALEIEGVKHIFGLPGNPRFLYDDLYDNPQISPVLVRHEAAGAFMATAYGRLKGQPGVCFASPGPGMANLLPGLLEAWSGCLPLVAFASAPSREFEGMGVFQETDSLALARPVTKWAVRVDVPERVGWTVARAFSLASNGRPGPVYIEIPADVAAAEVDMPDYTPLARPVRCGADPALVERAAALLENARRPVIWAGGGVNMSGAGAELEKLAALLHAPVVTTPQGRGCLPEDHPLAFGQVGLYRTESTAMAYDDADVVLIVGSQCEEFQSGLWQHFPPGARLVQLDIDACQLGRNWVPDVGIVADARLGLVQLAAGFTGMNEAGNARRSRLAGLQKAKADFERKVMEQCSASEPPLRARGIVNAINRVFGGATTLVNENGGLDLWSYYFPYYRVSEGGGCLAPAEQTCMGFGVAGVVGAGLARPDRYAVCVTGDGAFQMFLGEIATAVQHKAAVTWVVLNNRALGWIKYSQQMAGERYIATDFTSQPDFVHMAESAGCTAARISEPDQVEPALEAARRANDAGQPAVLDCRVDTWDDYPPGFYAFHKDVRGVPDTD